MARNHESRKTCIGEGVIFRKRKKKSGDSDRDPVLGVDAHVLGQVVGAHEALAALGALEALLARVRAPMPLQLVRAREALPAEQPVAQEGPLARVPAQVRAQVRRLAVHLVAAGDVAHVLLLAVHHAAATHRPTLGVYSSGRRVDTRRGW